jgi:hypothetical protein
VFVRICSKKNDNKMVKNLFFYNVHGEVAKEVDLGKCGRMMIV